MMSLKNLRFEQYDCEVNSKLYLFIFYFIFLFYFIYFYFIFFFRYDVIRFNERNINTREAK